VNFDYLSLERICPQNDQNTPVRLCFGCHRVLSGHILEGLGPQKRNLVLEFSQSTDKVTVVRLNFDYLSLERTCPQNDQNIPVRLSFGCHRVLSGHILEGLGPQNRNLVLEFSQSTDKVAVVTNFTVRFPDLRGPIVKTPTLGFRFHGPNHLGYHPKGLAASMNRIPATSEVSFGALTQSVLFNFHSKSFNLG
jgi:hypothetical protein